jgi:hypothetical protein
MHKYWARKPANIVAHYLQKYCPKGGIVCDPFMGSGVTVIEANLIGRLAIGIDINPVACFITEQTGTDFNLLLFSEALEFLSTRNSQENSLYNRLYSVICPKCGDIAELTHIIRINTYYKSGSQTNRDSSDGIQEIRIRCSNCKEICINKGAEFFNDTIKNFLEDREHIAGEYLSRAPFTIINQQFQYTENANFLQLRHSLRQDPRLRRLFSDPNLAFLLDLKASIATLPLKFDSVRNSLRFCLTGAIGQASNMVWVIDARKGTKLAKKQVGSWTHHFLWDPSEYFEVNAWACFLERADKIIAGKANLSERRSHSDVLPFIRASNFQHLTPDSPVLLLNQSSEQIPIPDNSVDFIFTDPPYGDSIQYGELSAIWAGFLDLDFNQYLAKIHESEIVINSQQNKSLPQYQEKLHRVFTEIYRILKPGRMAVITFHNTEFKTRNALIEAVLSAGFELCQILYQMPPRVSVKSLLHYSGSPVGDYYIRFKKNEKSRPFEKRSVISADEMEKKLEIIIREILCARGEPTSELWLMNFIDTYLCQQHLFPFPEFDNVWFRLKSNPLFTISKQFEWWFSHPEAVSKIAEPLSFRVQQKLQELIAKATHKSNDDYKKNQKSPAQYYYNEIYKCFKGILTPDKSKVNKLIDELLHFDVKRN